MGGGVVGLGHLVGALGEHLAVFDDDRREWSAAFGHVLAGEIDGALSEVGHTCQPRPGAIGAACDTN